MPWRQLALALVLASSSACIKVAEVLTGPPDTGGARPDAGVATCQPCVISLDCGASGSCVQYAAEDRCGVTCPTGTECGPTEDCQAATTFEGKEAAVCVPQGGGCGPGTGCGSCPPGTICDLALGACVSSVVIPAPDGGMCGSLAPPAAASCCHSCSPTSSKCQPNGCYGGWWCDTAASTSCDCVRPPTSCGQADAGTSLGYDAGAITGTVDPTGGTVSRLYFAVVGDTRPARLDDSDGYPTSVISRIYKQIQDLDPRPQFVLATGDFMFASPSGVAGEEQLSLYLKASGQFTNGPLFPVLGNQDCAGLDSTNCAGSPTSSYTAYLEALVHPLGQSAPYYVVHFKALDKSWTAKLVVIACNAWDTAQAGWLKGQLADPTTYTIVARHQPSGGQAPCLEATDGLLANAAYDILIAGHVHTFGRVGKTLIVGNGGAPLTGGAPFGYATVEQRGGEFLVTDYDSQTAAPISSFTMP